MHTQKHLQNLLQVVMEKAQLFEALTPELVATKILAWLQDWHGNWSEPKLAESIKLELQDAGQAGIKADEVAKVLNSFIEAKKLPGVITRELADEDMKHLSELLGTPIGPQPISNAGESKVQEMKCPKCGSEMSRGAPHSEGSDYQWECHKCGKIIPVSSRSESKVNEKEKLILARGWYKDNPEDYEIMAKGKKAGDTFVVEAGAPGSGRTVYKITKVDDQGLWGYETESTVDAGESRKKVTEKDGAPSVAKSKDKVFKPELKKGDKLPEPGTEQPEVKDAEQNTGVDDEEHRCASDEMGMQDPDKMPKDSERDDVIVQIEGKVPSEPSKADQEKTKKALLETEEINKLYADAGLPAPDGKGEHTPAFHKLAIEIAKSYVKSGDSPKAALDKAYPTAMKQLGADKAVNPPHRKHTEEKESKVHEYTSQDDPNLSKIYDDFADDIDLAYEDAMKKAQKYLGKNWAAKKEEVREDLRFVVEDAVPHGATEEGKAPISTDTAEQARKKLKEEDKIPGGLADDRKPEDFDIEQLRMGIEVEMEHTDDPATAREIAMDHLVEDPEYYTKLKAMEAGKGAAAPVEEGASSGTTKLFRDIVAKHGAYVAGKLYANRRSDGRIRYKALVGKRKTEDAIGLPIEGEDLDTLYKDLKTAIPSIKPYGAGFVWVAESVQIEEGLGPDLEQYNVTDEELETLHKAQDAGIVPEEYPDEATMYDELSGLEDIVNPEDMPDDSIRMAYLKYVMIPKAIAHMKESKKRPFEQGLWEAAEVSTEAQSIVVREELGGYGIYARLDKGKFYGLMFVASDGKDPESEALRRGDVLAKTMDIPFEGLVEESKMKEGLAPDQEEATSYHQRLFDFLDHPWQEDAEIELVNLIGEYRNQFRVSPPRRIQDYLRRLVTENNIFGDQRFSEDFTAQIHDLLGVTETKGCKQLPLESTVDEQGKEPEEYDVVAHGMIDKIMADRFAKEVGGQAVPDDMDKKKFKVIKPKKVI